MFKLFFGTTDFYQSTLTTGWDIINLLSFFAGVLQKNVSINIHEYANEPIWISVKRTMSKL